MLEHVQYPMVVSLSSLPGKLTGRLGTFGPLEMALLITAPEILIGREREFFGLSRTLIIFFFRLLGFYFGVGSLRDEKINQTKC